MQPKSQSALWARPGVRALKGAGIGDLHPHMKAVRCPNAWAQLPWSNVVSALWMARVERSLLSLWTPHSDTLYTRTGFRSQVAPSVHLIPCLTSGRQGYLPGQPSKPWTATHPDSSSNTVTRISILWPKFSNFPGHSGSGAQGCRYRTRESDISPRLEQVADRSSGEGSQS
jgi:hypothetical protein